jgi:PEGA domain-containing protein
MQKLTLITIVALCLGAVSCVHTHHNKIQNCPVSIAVQAQSVAVFEVLLDGKLVGSGKTPSKGMVAVSFSAPQGEHILQVKTEGYAPWKRIVSIFSTPKGKPQSFFAKLKPLKK